MGGWFGEVYTVYIAVDGGERAGWDGEEWGTTDRPCRLSRRR